MNNKTNHWFNPGDKVVRINEKPPDILPNNLEIGVGCAPYGKTMCVEYCKYIEEYKSNWISFVGGDDYEYYSNNFRTVDEIKECLEAVRDVRKQEYATT